MRKSRPDGGFPETVGGFLARAVDAALAEDLGGRPGADVTTASILGERDRGTAFIILREQGIAAGIGAASAVFSSVERSLTVECPVSDGDTVKRDAVLMKISGRLAPILTAERTALNFLQRMSGIATLTSIYVRAVAGTGARITDTRKTAPGLRALDKLAVRLGGGVNHRMGLHDMALIKDNHIVAAGGLGSAVERCLKGLKSITGQPPGIRIEVETRTLAQVREALGYDEVDRIMFDNFSIPDLSAAVKLVGGRKETEASGGITLEDAAAVAATGVGFISVGALTHSVRALDIALDLRLS